jgi:hypothetical protein
MSRKTCHDCGLEAVDDCEVHNKHIPFDEQKIPCRFCKRNPKPERPVTDFYSETWTLLSDGTPTIEDPDPHEQTLLKFLHEVVDVYAYRR